MAQRTGTRTRPPGVTGPVFLNQLNYVAHRTRALTIVRLGYRHQWGRGSRSEQGAHCNILARPVKQLGALILFASENWPRVSRRPLPFQARGLAPRAQQLRPGFNGASRHTAGTTASVSRFEASKPENDSPRPSVGQECLTRKTPVGKTVPAMWSLVVRAEWVVVAAKARLSATGLP